MTGLDIPVVETIACIDHQAQPIFRASQCHSHNKLLINQKSVHLRWTCCRKGLVLLRHGWTETIAMRRQHLLARTANHIMCIMMVIHLLVGRGETARGINRRHSWEDALPSILQKGETMVSWSAFFVIVSSDNCQGCYFCLHFVAISVSVEIYCVHSTLYVINYCEVTIPNIFGYFHIQRGYPERDILSQVGFTTVCTN